MQKPLILFGTLGCHLCEDAERILQALKLPYQYVDIIEDEKLLERYQISIPVLLENTSDQENILAWPFNGEQVSQWLLSHRTK
ncbi:glutaredoxin family protein [Methylophilus sp. YYY-1]|uniref:glutaredoxin family protein n=1 Tax=Methylophilus sp. YYY-1 TaxID=2682087 RepID=UPI0023B3575F|nr:glutaredoxin family protein [Methylophilus sp. YYY-1]MDF0377840.1 glutaredoxin family protein [Methylophilus sp. YYY-1]